MHEDINVDDLLLGEREKEVWELYADMTYTEVADELGIKPNTVQTHLDRIYQKRKKAKNTLAWMESVEGGSLSDFTIDAVTEESNGGDDARDSQ